MRYKRYTKEELFETVRTSISFSEVCRKLDKKPVGGTITNIKLMCDRYNVDYSHMAGKSWKKGIKDSKRKSPDERLIMGTSIDHRLSTPTLRKSLLETGIKYQCVECGITEWNNKPLTLEIDHIDGVYWNNTKENLQFLCPNCHSQKPR